MISMINKVFSLLAMLSFSLSLLHAEDGSGWPKKIEEGGATIVIYQPQIEALTSNTMESRAAVSITNEEFTSPIFGAMWFDCKISTDRDDRTVQLINIDVSAARFPEIEEEKIMLLSALLEEEVPNWEIEMSLDQLLADLDMEETSVSLSSGLNNTPPEIIYSTTPTVLIIVDGDPIFQEIEKTNYERVLNTPFLVVKDAKKGGYYLNGGDHWYRSDNMADWEYTEKVPKKLVEIAEEALDAGEDGYAAQESEVDPSGSEVEAEDVIPAIILRTTPAELLQSDGEPDFAPVEGTSVLYMTNTADDILMSIETQEYYILVAGRWYSSESLDKGPWSFVEPDQVPEVFTEIPAESDMGSVRSSISGTVEAKEAILENQIPQTAEVDRKEAKLEVSYDGKPKFESIEETKMKYAINTDKSVLLIDNRYYCCDNAIWFESDSPSGPWVVSTFVPESVQEIPPESPVYNVKYVYIYESTPEVVYVGYTPGYVHSYAYHGCVYYGTGYYYRPWYGVHYYPRPVTYGFSVRWNPYSGWGFSYGVSFGWMTVGWGAPYYGYWGPAGYRRGYHYGYHHGYARGYRAGYRAGHRPPPGRPGYGRPTPYNNRHVASNNVYKNRSQGVRRTGNTHYDPKSGNRVSTQDRSRPSAQPANRDNNMYTDRNGNVYRKDGDNFNRVDNSRPSTGQQPSTREARPSTGEGRPSTGQQPSTREARPSTGQQPSTREARPSTRQSPSQSLNHDYNSRNRGAERTQNYNQNRSRNQYSRPSTPSRSASPSRSTSPSRSSSSRSSSRRR